jgi:phage head maturation protease
MYEPYESSLSMILSPLPESTSNPNARMNLSNLPTPANQDVSTASRESAPAPELSQVFGPRLVTLCDGRPGLRGGLQAEICDSGSGEICENSCLDFVASDASLDRFDEIISPEGWRLDHYRRNPVFQNAHQYGDVIFTLGKALVTEVRMVAGRPALYQRIEFAVEVNPMARIAYGLYRGKFLNAVSVGFIPIRWQDGAASGASADGQPPFRRKYLEQELLEVSAVGIPANPEALQLGLKAGAIQKADLGELLEVLRAMAGASVENFLTDRSERTDRSDQQFRGDREGARADTSALGPGANEAQLLRLARELRRMLRRA